jgi:hypothetical protein
MEFFDKKQDVIDLQLTSYGKQLLSRGLFKPSYYAFSDDGVIYDNRWGGTVSKEPQSKAERRIQEDTPRLKTQYTKVGAERGINNIFNSAPGTSQKQNVIDLFEFTSEQDYKDHLAKANASPLFAETEKLLENVLGTKKYFNNYNVAWNLLFYNGLISDSTPYYQKDDITTLVPQINCSLNDVAYKVELDFDVFEDIKEVKNIMDKLAQNEVGDFDSHAGELLDDEDDELMDPGGHAEGALPDTSAAFFEYWELDDGAVFFKKDFLFLSVEELNSQYSDDNFSIEVFEITEAASRWDVQEMKKMYFSELSNIPTAGSDSSLAVENVFEILMDREVDNELACSLIGFDKQLKAQSVYNTNIYDCTPIADDTMVVDPYDNLPPVDTEDVC